MMEDSLSLISSSSESDPESSSDSEILHELCNKVNLGLANASTVESSSLSATITTDCAANACENIDMIESKDYDKNKNASEMTNIVIPLSSTKVPKIENKEKSKNSNKSFREPTLQHNDSIEKVLKVFRSKFKLNSEPQTSQIPKDNLILNAENLLILNLLGMKSDEREQYLIEMAKKRKLLLTNEKTNTFNVNPDLFCVDCVPQVVDFVHQYHGKPIGVAATVKQDLTAKAAKNARKLKRKLKKKEKLQKEQAVEQNRYLKIATAKKLSTDLNKTDIERSNFANIHDNKQAAPQQVQRIINCTSVVLGKKSKSKSCQLSTQSASMNNLNSIVEVPRRKQRACSASGSWTELLRPADVHRHDAGEEFSKRQQKRLLKQLKAMNIQSTTLSTVEKSRRKRGSRGGKKDGNGLGLKNQTTQHAKLTVQTTKTFNPNVSKSKTDLAAKNVMSRKCSQINANIQEKLNLFSSIQNPGPSKPHNIKIEDFVVESIATVDQAEEGEESSSDESDSSNFPTDEDTTSYLARSDEMESSCNEKRLKFTVEKPVLIKGSALNDDMATHKHLVMDRLKMDASMEADKSGNPSPSILRINNEAVLIMSLLTASAKVRDSLLLKAANDSNIFLKKQNKTILNPRLAKMKTVFASPLIINFIKNNSSKQHEEKNNFESEINRLVRRYVPEVDLYRYMLGEMSLHSGCYAFNDPENKKAIYSFVEKLTDNNLGRVIEGEIRVNEYDNSQAFMTNEDDDRDVYFGSTLLRQCALHCSRVKAFVFTVQDRTLFMIYNQRIVRGFVVEILDDQLKEIIGKFDIRRPTTSSLQFIPDDRRFLRINVDKTSDPLLFSKNIPPKADFLYLVKLKYWKDRKSYGAVVEEIGKTDELETGNRAVLLKNYLKPLIFSNSIMELLPKDPFVIPEIEYSRREVLTKDCIFTIDPLTARDLDDAVSCRKLENGNFEIGVHISDVSHFIIENSELDNLIKDQTTTIYLVNTVYHMLPRELCMLCSLLPGQNKLTFSVFWEINPKAKVISTRFSKTIINSCAQLAYEHAQVMIDEPDKIFEDKDLPKIHNGFHYRDLSHVINNLNSIATILRKQRFDNGCISINQTKIMFDLNDDGDPIAFRPAERNESNFLIEEFMLLANQSVATFIYEKFPNIAVLRNHAPPKANMMEELVAKLRGLNYKFDISSSKAVSKSLTEIIRSSGNCDAVSMVLNAMVAKPFVRAEYFCSGKIKSKMSLRHYALAIPIYTHFTSPIRRYPDILVHRLLAAALSLSPIPSRSPDELKLIARNCNDQKYNAKLAGEDSTNLYFLHYLQRFGPIKMKAAVKELTRGADLHLMLIDTGHNIKVDIKTNVPELIFKLSENGVPTIQFIGCENLPPIRINIFDVVHVEVDVKHRHIKAKLVLPN